MILTALLFFGLGAPLASVRVCDVDGDSDIDRNDISLIFNAAVKKELASGPDDPRDADGDGRITVNDGRRCVLQCTLPNCAVPNQPPTADAGADQNAAVGAPVTLNGSGSGDPDNGPSPLTFLWTFSSAPQTSGLTNANITDPTSAAPSFTPDAPGSYTLNLTVSDGALSNSDQVTIVATALNVAPNADAGPDQNAAVGAPVTLNGAGSGDPDNGPSPLTFLWTFSSTPPDSGLTNANIVNATSASPGFTPDAPGSYTLNLTVSDGALSNSDQVTIVATAPNVAPNANAGPDQNTRAGRRVTLNGGASGDPDSGPGPLTFLWSFVSVPPGSALTNAAILDAAAVSPSFTPDVDGTYLLSLQVSDGALTGADQVMVTAGNHPPAAAPDAYGVDEDQTLATAAPGVLINDTDPEGDALTAALVAGPLHGALTLNADGSFTYAPDPNFNGTDTFTYRARDGDLDGNVATVTVTVNPVNDPPTADAGPDQALLVGDAIRLSGAGSSDPDGDPLTYQWSFTSVPPGSAAALSNPAAVAPSFVADVIGTYRLQLVVNDSKINSPPQFVNISANPPPNRAPAAADDAYGVDEDNILNVSAPGVLVNDLDADGNPLTVLLVAGVSHGSLTLQTDGSFVYTPDANFNGTDSFTYRASDGSLLSDIATVTLSVNPVPDIRSAIHIKITTPLDGDAAADPFIDVEGTVDDPEAYVEVNGIEAEVSSDGRFLAPSVRLYAGENQLTAQASNPTGQTDADSVEILYQPASKPMSMRIVSPQFGGVLGSPKFEVIGIVSDPTATVLVNDTLARTEEDFFKASIYACDSPGGEAVPSSWDCDVTVTAYAGDGQTTTNHFVYTYSPAADPLTVKITSPAQDQTVIGAPIEIRGKIHDPLSAVSPTVVTVNGNPATVVGDAFSASVDLGFSSEFVNQGVNYIQVRATNAAGAAEDAIKIIYEPSDRPLTVSLYSLPEQAVVNFTPIRLFGSVSDSTAAVEINGIRAEQDFRSFSLLSAPLSLGVNTITVTARRPNGETAADTRTVTYDPNYPSPPAPILNPLPSYSRRAAVEVTGLTLSSDRAEIFVNGQSRTVAFPDSTGRIKATVFLSQEGANSIAARALDGFGNKSGFSGERVVVRDTMRPFIQRAAVIIDRLDLSVSRGILVGRTEAAAQVEIRMDNDPDTVYHAAADAQGGFAVPIHLSAGQHFAGVRVTDPAGNIGVASAGIAIHNLFSENPIPPAIDPLPSPIDETGVTVAGNAYALSFVEVYRNGDLMGTAQADHRGRFRLEGVGLVPGENLIRVVQRAGQLDGNNRLYLLNAAASRDVSIEVVSGTPSRPQVRIEFPPEGAVTDAVFLPLRGGVTGSTDRLRTNVYYGLQGYAARAGDQFVSAQKIPLLPGPNVLWIEATAPDGARGVDKITVYSQRGAEVPAVQIAAPAREEEVHEPFIAPSGSVGEAVQKVVVNESEAVIQNGAFLSAPIDVFGGYVYNPDGEERLITAWAEDGSGRIGHVDVPFGYRYIPPPQLLNVTPLNGAVLNASPARVTGQASPADEVTVNGVTARIDGGVFAADVDLQEGANIIQIVAKNSVKGAVQTIQVTYLPGIPVTLDSLKIEPQSLVLSKGDKVQVRAIGTYSNGQTLDVTQQAVWSSGRSEIASVNGGLVVAQGEGAGIILTAVYQGLSAAASVTAQPPALRSILVSHAVIVNGETLYVSDEVKLPVGQSQALSAFGEYSDGSVINITPSVSWTSGDPSIATVDHAGLASALKPGNTQIIAGQGSVTGSAQVTVTPPPLYLFITSPTDGSTVHRAETTISGTILTPAPEAGITVNGVLAHVFGNQFVANGVALTEGMNTITAKATDSYGQQVEAKVTVNAATTEPQITLTATIDSGIAPLEATLKLDAPFAYTNPLLSYTGPGLAEVTIVSQEEYRAKMTAEGIYAFTIQVTDSQAAAHTAGVSIVAQNKSALDALLKSKWEEMKGSLARGDVEAALGYFTPRAQQKYRYVFESLQSNLPAIANELQPIRLVGVQDGVVECFTNRIENGILNAYFIYFSVDSNGLLKLSGL